MFSQHPISPFGVDGSGDGFGGCDGNYIKDGGSGTNEGWDGRSGDVGEFESFRGSGLQQLSGELNSGVAESVHRWFPALHSLTLPPCRKKGATPCKKFMTEERHEASNVVSQKTFFNLDCIDNPNQGGRKIDKYVSCHDIEHIYDYGSGFYTFGNYLASSEAKRCIGAVSQSPRRGLLRAGSKSLVMAVHSEQMILAGTKSAIPTVQLFGSLNWVMHSLGQSYQTHTTADQAQDSFKARWCVGLRFGSFLVTAILLILCLVSSSTVHGLEFWRGS